MDLSSIRYFVELAKDLHITHAAERLYISQQTLSNHIKRLEDELNTQLFVRKPIPQLTDSGKLFLEFAKSIMLLEDNFKKELYETIHEERGLIRFGASNLRMNACLPDVLPKFTNRYPNVSVQIEESVSTTIETELLNNELDLAIIISDNLSPGLRNIPILDDKVYLCITESLLREHFGESSDVIIKKSIDGADLRDFAKLPFCMLDNRIGDAINVCFENAGIKPKVYMTSRYIQIGTNIGLTGKAVFFSTRTNIINIRRIPSDPVYIFPLKMDNVHLSQHLSLVSKQDAYQPLYQQYFSQLIIEHFEEMSSIFTTNKIENI